MRRAALRQRERRVWLSAIPFLLPAIIVYGVFVFYPILNTFRLSLFRWDGINPVKIFVGFKNFVNMWRDPEVGNAAIHSLQWAAVMCILPVAIAQIMAAMLAQDIHGRLAYRTLFFIPVTLATSATAVIWKWMYNPFFGLFNEGLKMLGIQRIAFLGEPAWAMPAMLLADTWADFGFYMVIFMAAIQGISPTLYDAAEIDGANKLQEFRYVTVPSLRNITTLAITVSLINSLQVFTIIKLMTDGGPNRATETMSVMIYNKAFEDSRMGFGAAIAVVFSIGILVLTIVYRKVRRRLDV